MGRPAHPEAVDINVEPNLPVGHHRIDVGDVAVDAFWSISLHNEAGFFEENEMGACGVNRVTAARNHDGSITVHLGPGTSDLPNLLPITEGWNDRVRLYRPRPEVLDGPFVLPSAVPG